ncbi:MAG: VanZ family protein [Clostridia bacterium]|nr:VanZ family protein [Clostridia bacterium]
MTEIRTKTKYLRAGAAAAALALMGVIFFFSAQPASDSDEVSIWFTMLLFFFRDEAAAHALNGVVREAAHMLEYAALAVPVWLFFSTFRLSRGWRGIAAFAVCLLYAVSDEVHQLFVPGRAAELFDVLMDSIGAALSVTVLHLLAKRRSRKRRPVARTQLSQAERDTLAAFSAYVRRAPTAQAVEDPEGFVHVSIRHKILPMTAQALLQADPPLPSETAEQIRAEALGQVVAQTRRTEQFLRACRAMQAAGVNPICVKGIVCRALYPDFDLRISADEDLLVRPADAAVCAQVLASLGFEAAGTPDDMEIGYYHAESGCRIELHRAMFPADGGVYDRFNALLGDLFASPMKLQIGQTTLLCPAPDQHLLYLVLHAYKHFLISGVGIRQIADIALFARAFPPDWKALFAACDAVRLTGFLNAVLVLGGRYFDLPLSTIDAAQFRAETDADALLQDVMAGGIYGSKNTDHLHSGALTFQQYAAALAGKRPKGFAALFPPRDRMRRKYPYLKKHGWLLPFAYLSRLLRYAVSDHDSARALDTADRRTELLRQYGMIP